VDALLVLRYNQRMTTTVEAIYENGVLKLAKPLTLADKTPVKVTIQTDSEREAWLKASEESLMKVWDNDADDIFNELLKR
jgi:predicted DNA-binding antitoxin AbrB/MazE fold protein